MVAPPISRVVLCSLIFQLGALHVSANESVEAVGMGNPLKHINVICTKTHAVITYVGDPKAVVAFGDSGECPFDVIADEAKHTLVARYTRTHPKDCIMQKRPMQNIYHIEIQARFTAPDMEAEGDETAILSCNFEVLVTSQAETILLDDPQLQPIIVEDKHARPAESNFTLSVHTGDGLRLPRESIVGTEVELIALMSPAPGEVAFQVLLCYADMPEASLSVPIIVGGCGSGQPFGTDSGFVRYKLFAKSPSFGLFRAAKSDTVQFRCEFMVCPDSCDMYSCPEEREEYDRRYRARRSTGLEVPAKRVWAKTAPHRVYLKGESRVKELEFTDLVMAQNDNLSDPLWNRHQLKDPKATTARKSKLVLPQKFLILIVVGGVLVLVLFSGAIWLGWRYATRSFRLTFTPGRAPRDISPPRPISVPRQAFREEPLYDLPL